MPQADDFDANHQLKHPLRFDQFDEWIKQWTGARHYFVYLALDASSSFAGTKPGALEFSVRVGAWASALAQHMRDLGLSPRQLGLSLVDEPHTDQQDAAIVAWVKAIKAAAPELTVFSNPTSQHPHQAHHQESLTIPDILCPNLQIFNEGGDAVAQYFARRRAAGQQLWFYQCSGPARLYDPDRYYRAQAWHAFRYGANGIGYWSFGDLGGAESSWNEYACTVSAYTPAFVGLTDATDSIHWQAVREGIEDYEYLAMVRDRIQQTEEAHKKAGTEALLSKAITAVLGDGSPTYNWDRAVDRSVPDTYRLRLLQFLERR